MTPRVNVTPNPAPRGKVAAADMWCLDPRYKYDLVTVDSLGHVAGAGQNGIRGLPGQDAVSGGVMLPASGTKCQVQLRRGKTVWASVDVGLTG